MKRNIEPDTQRNTPDPAENEIVQEELVPAEEDRLPESKRNRPVKQFRSTFIGIAARLAAAGFSQEYIAIACGVAERTILEWKNKYPAFRNACDEGKLHAERQLVARGLRAAGGYNIRSRKIKIHKTADGDTETTTEISTKHFPPDAQLLVFFLVNMNRKRGQDDWVQPKTIEVNSKTLNLNNLPANASKALDALAAAFQEEEDQHRKAVESHECENAGEPGEVFSEHTENTGGKRGVSVEATRVSGEGRETTIGVLGPDD
jgi:hypothetical protein